MRTSEGSTGPTPLDDAVAGVLRGHSSVVLAVSGGIDSMTLLDIASRVSDARRLCVATFDHGTGAVAEAAVALVERRAKELGIDCIVGRATSMLASEADFRAARWEFLRNVAVERSARVATAHTDDDQIETVLMRMMRGAGTRGLAALAARSEVLRPLLRTTRRDISAYATARGLVWIEDPTNSAPTYFRNRLRADLLPAMRRVDPAIDDTLRAVGEEAAAWRADVVRVCDQMDEVRLLAGAAGVCVSVATVRDESVAPLIWPELAGRVGAVLDRRGMERLTTFTVASRVGARMPLSGGWQVTRGRRELVLSRTARDTATAGPFALSNGTRLGEWTFHTQAASGLTSFRDPWSAWLPADAPLRVRPWRAGDAMTFGDSGSRRKVKHLLSAAGVTGHERAGWPVVLSGDDIVWIPGVRRGDAATARSGRPGLAFVCEYDNR